MTEWKTEWCSELPSELEEISPTTYIERKNIEEEVFDVDGSDSGETYVRFTCQSRIITKTEYQMVKAIENIDTADAIDAYTMQLIEEGVL